MCVCSLDDVPDEVLSAFAASQTSLCCIFELCCYSAVRCSSCQTLFFSSLGPERAIVYVGTGSVPSSDDDEG